MSKAPEPLIPANLERLVAEVPSAWKRAALRSMYVVAGSQRRYGERRIHTWPAPKISRELGVHAVTFSCERDRLAVTRMVSSFLHQVGRPRSFTVISDGTLSDQTTRSLQRLDKAVVVHDWRAVVANAAPLPAAVRKYCVHPLGRKLASLMVWDTWPLVFVDSDVEFFAGGWRLAGLLSNGVKEPLYLQEPTRAYDERLARLVSLPSGINSGFFVAPSALDWTEAADAFEALGEPGVEWTEQTMVARALIASGARALPERDYVVYWDDIKWPWDAVAGRDVVLRHYIGALHGWKLWMRGGPANYRSIPLAVAATLLSRVGQQVCGERLSAVA